MLFLLLACGGATPADAPAGPPAPSEPAAAPSDPGLAIMKSEPGIAGGMPAAPSSGASCALDTPLLAAATWGNQAGKPFVMLTVDAMDPSGMDLHGPMTATGATVEGQEGQGDHQRAALLPDRGVRAATVRGTWRCGPDERTWSLHLDLGGNRSEGGSVPARLESTR